MPINFPRIGVNATMAKAKNNKAILAVVAPTYYETSGACPGVSPLNKVMSYSFMSEARSTCGDLMVPYLRVSVGMTKPKTATGTILFDAGLDLLTVSNWATIADVIAAGFTQRGAKFLKNALNSSAYEYELSWSKTPVLDSCSANIGYAHALSISKFAFDANNCSLTNLGSEKWGIYRNTTSFTTPADLTAFNTVSGFEGAFIFNYANAAGSSQAAFNSIFDGYDGELWSI